MSDTKYEKIQQYTLLYTTKQMLDMASLLLGNIEDSKDRRINIQTINTLAYELGVALEQIGNGNLL